MTEPDDGPITPDAPRPPGTPEIDLDVEIPETEREKPDTDDLDQDAAEPPS
ncbi:MAG TPA: hypothetical protein VGL47_04370 [Amycolatopsis sp.]|uniref:Uncharacterized protein n=1 Tax=Amycolatopsis nalaikhensis TaxID=715472 RepID=A0ABY8XF96_9PSEU|nr:hypothetical protein [Amycolatopsis sp. 2-2]WIV54294.1 hypothetical protein QP939_36285 [Amycolatopsis sp. 2-2]